MQEAGQETGQDQEAGQWAGQGKGQGAGQEEGCELFSVIFCPERTGLRHLGDRISLLLDYHSLVSFKERFTYQTAN